MFEKLKKNIETKKVNKTLKQAGMQSTGNLDIDRTFAQMAKFSGALNKTEYHTGKTFDVFMEDIRKKAKKYNENYNDTWDDGIKYFALDTEDDIKLRRLHKQLDDDWNAINTKANQLVDPMFAKIGPEHMILCKRMNNTAYELEDLGERWGNDPVFEINTPEGLKEAVFTIIYECCKVITPVDNNTCCHAKEFTHYQSALVEQTGIIPQDPSLGIGAGMSRGYAWVLNVVQALLINGKEKQAETFTKEGIEALYNAQTENLKTKIDALPIEVLHELWDAYMEMERNGVYPENRHKQLLLRVDNDGIQKSGHRTENKIWVFDEDQSLAKIYNEKEEAFHNILKKYNLYILEYPNYKEIFEKYDIKDEYVTTMYLSKFDFAFAQKKYRTEDYLRLCLRQQTKEETIFFTNNARQRNQTGEPMTLGEMYAHYICEEQNYAMYRIMEYTDKVIPEMVEQIRKYLGEDTDLQRPTNEELSQNDLGITIILE